MKLFFKMTIFLWAASLPARNIVIITYHKQEKKADLVAKIMHDRMKIPLLLIKKRWQEKACSPKMDAILQICLQDDGNILFPVLKRDILLRSFSVFNQKEK